VHSDAFGAVALAEAEGFVCQTYQKCCRDPSLDDISIDELSSGSPGSVYVNSSSSKPGTCLDAHAGTATDITVAFEDVSSNNFCAYVSGGRYSYSTPSGVCDLIAAGLPGWSLDACRTDFCTLGTDGYFDFVRRVVDLIRQYSYYLAAGFATWALFQLAITINLWNLSRSFRKELRERRASRSAGKQSRQTTTPGHTRV